MFSQIKLASYLAASTTMTSGLVLEEGEVVFDRSTLNDHTMFRCDEDRSLLLNDPL